ncbi:MAG: 4-alpha-glucanotransferase [Gemmatimonadetes bacterium]|nr:4-alpha-glucanotransferase [Gemmatimonadota bacterium]
MPPRAAHDAGAPAAGPGIDPDLEALARLHGVQPTYRTAGGEERTPDPDAVLAVLRVLGAPVEGHADVAAALRAGASERGRSLLPPVAVAWEGRGGSVPLHLLESEADGALGCRLLTGSGDTVEWDGDLRTTGSQVVEGQPVLDARLDLPTDLPPGYHDLDVRVGAREARCRIVVAPPRAWTPEGEARGWGAFLPLYALRSGRTRAVADLTDLEALERWVADLGGEIVGTLPILAAFLDEEPFEPSPYAPVSRLFWNELYLDPERAPGWEEATEARRLLASPEVRETLGRLRDERHVDYREAARIQRRVLESLAGSFAPADGPLPAPLALFAEIRPEALRYARFRAVGEREGRGWREWSAAPRAGTLHQDDYDESAVRYHLYAQWAMDEALQRLGERHAGLYLDLPLGTHADGFDVWRFRDLFAEGASAGAPPDAFFAGGQDWGIPPMHPRRLRESQHAYWAATLRRLMGASAMLRLDHVMSLHRLYWVPRGFPATEGVYVRYPAEELYAVLCLESHRHRCEVVGEDLGTVPGEVREAMERHALRRMYVVPFELGGEGAERARFHPVPASAVASLGTHDTAPWSGFWDAVDVEQRVEDGQLEEDRAEDEKAERKTWRRSVRAALEVEEGTEEDVQDGAASVLRAALRFLAASPARLVLVSLEDLWGETEPQNVPGTTGDANWRRKAAHTLEEIRDMEQVGSLLQEVDALRRGGGDASTGGDDEYDE